MINLRRHILFVIDSLDVGGTEMNAVRTGEALVRRGVKLTVVHFQSEGPLLERWRDSGAVLKHVPVASLTSLRGVMSLIQLGLAIRDIRADIVNSHDVYSNIFSALTHPWFSGTPLVTSRRWLDQVPAKRLIPLNAWAHRQSRAVLTNSGRLEPTLYSEGVHPNRVRVVPNFLDDSTSIGECLEDRRRFRSEWGVKEDEVVIGVMARLDKVKRHDIGIDAFEMVKTSTRSRLVIIGDGPEGDAIRQRVERSPARDRIVLTGALPNVPRPNHAFDIALLTSDSEGFPNSLLESAGCARAIIATDVGGVADIVDHGRTGLLVPKGDRDTIASALAELISDDQRRTVLGNAAAEHVRFRFSEGAVVDQLLSLYEECLIDNPASEPIPVK